MTSLAAQKFHHRTSPSRGWSFAASWLAVLFFVMPLLSLAVIALAGGASAFPNVDVIWQSLFETVLLLSGVGAIALLLAVPLAWVISRYDFPLRRQIEILSVLPLALPAYLAAYAYVSLTDFFGPLQSELRLLSGMEKLPWFPDLRSLPGACFVMAVTLYPYVYLPARWSFERQSLRQIEAARSLGARGAKLFFRIAVPLAWPAIVAGLILVLLETLNDIGATQYLGVQSLTVVTFTTWTVRDNLPGAAQLALLLLFLVSALVFLERKSRRKRRYADPARHSAMPDRIILRGVKGWLLAALALIPFLLGFLAPGYELLERSLRDVIVNGIRPETAAALLSTLVLATLATLVILTIGFGLILLQRVRAGRIPMTAINLSTLGYGIPGLILVLGLLPLAGAVDRSLNALGLIGTAVLSGSFVLLILAYALRFTAIATGQADAAMKRLSMNVDHAATTLGCTPWQLVSRILTPQLLPVAGAAGILIAVDCIKELPATLLLRPFNVDTLATLVYEAASRGAFEEGAVAAMLIVLVGLVPLVLLFRLIARQG